MPESNTPSEIIDNDDGTQSIVISGEIFDYKKFPDSSRPKRSTMERKSKQPVTHAKAPKPGDH